MYNEIVIIQLLVGCVNIETIEKLLIIGEQYKIIKLEDRKEKNKMIKIIYVESKTKKDKCPLCGEYTSSIHDKLKPM